MAFDPDAYLAESSGFDPDEYLGATAPAQPNFEFKLPQGFDFSTEAEMALSPEKRADLETARKSQLEIYGKDAANIGPPAGKRDTAILEEFRRQAPKNAVFARDVEEFGAAPEVNKFDMSSIKSALAGNLITNAAELASALKNNIAGSEISQDPEGNPLITMPDGKPYAINKPGLSGQDFAQFATRALLLAPSARGLSGVALPTLGKVSARTAATETALQGVESGVGGEFSPGQIALAAGTAAPAQIVGEKVITPVLSGVAGSLKAVFNKGKDAVVAFRKSIDQMSDEGASTLLAESMVREGITPEQFAAKLADLGEEGLPADVGSNFSRLLRLAANKVPRLEGKAKDVLGARQAGQGERIVGAFEDSSGIPALNVDDEIVRLNQAFKPEIDNLYAAARDKPLNVSENFQKLIYGDNSLSRAMQKAQVRLNDKRAVGDKIGNIDVIDATKQELDDQIGVALRQGEKNKVRDLVRLKNVMIDEVDKAVPEYKQARDMFAGKASLENAAESGGMFFKLKSREIDDITKSMSTSEKRMFKLGAKQAVIDKLDTMQLTADSAKRLFGKSGDIKKLESLFDDKDAFNRFSKTMETEAKFILTRRAAQENSTTAKQLFDESSSFNSLSSARAAFGDPIAAADIIASISSGISKKKGSAAYTKSLEKAGDILLSRGMPTERIIEILRRGSKQEIEKVVKDSFFKGLPQTTINAAALSKDEE